MNIALVLQQQMVAAIARFLCVAKSRQLPAPRLVNTQHSSLPYATNFVATTDLPARGNLPNAPYSLARPLRVVRMVEPGQASASVGRMVISGRMADVCAELDRLAAKEVALG
jgi:hypothetical protein